MSTIAFFTTSSCPDRTETPPDRFDKSRSVARLKTASREGWFWVIGTGGTRGAMGFTLGAKSWAPYSTLGRPISVK